MAAHPSFTVTPEALQQIWPIAMQYQIKALAKYALNKKLLAEGVCSAEQVIAGHWSPLAYYVLLFCSSSDEEKKSQVGIILNQYFTEHATDCAAISDYAAFELLALFYWLNTHCAEAFSDTLNIVFKNLKQKLSGKPLKEISRHALSGVMLVLHLTHNVTLQESLTAEDALYTPRLSRSGGVADVVRVLMYVFVHSARSLTSAPTQILKYKEYITF